MKRRASQPGQATLEYAILTAGVIVPMTFGIIYLAQMLWIWHSVAEFTRDGARYAATHCWQASADNVLSYMRTNVPLMVDQDQFRTGAVDIQVDYLARDPDSGTLNPFSCDTECSASCVPDAVTVRILNYQFRAFVGYLGIQPVSMPDFQTSVAIESAGCDPEQGTCLP